MPVDLKLLEETPTFRSLEPQKRVQLASLLKYVHFDAREPICERGHHGETMYFIEKGEVVFYSHDATGEEKVLRTLGAGNFFGEIAVLSQGRRSANAKAKTEVFAWELHQDDFPAFMEASPEIAMRLMKEMAHRLETSEAMLHDMVTPSIAQKIDASRNATEKTVENLVRNVGGMPFLIFNLVGCAAWVLVNKLSLVHWDTPEFAILALVLAFEALLVTILVLAKQNRDEKDANIRNDTIMEKVQITPLEIKHLREQVTALAELIHADRHNPQQPPK